MEKRAPAHVFGTTRTIGGSSTAATTINHFKSLVINITPALVEVEVKVVVVDSSIYLGSGNCGRENSHGDVVTSSKY